MDHVGSASTPDVDAARHLADEVAFRGLYDDHLEPVWRFARRRCDSTSDADDVAGETFAVAWRRRADLPPPDEVGLWLFGVARRVLANQRRSAERQHRLRLRLATTPTAPTASAPADEGIGERDVLAAAFAAIDPDDRDLLALRAWDGLAVTEIAVLLGCSPNAASIRLHKARRRLTQAMVPKDAVASRTSTDRPTERKEDDP